MSPGKKNQTPENRGDWIYVLTATLSGWRMRMQDALWNPKPVPLLSVLKIDDVARTITKYTYFGAICINFTSS